MSSWIHQFEQASRTADHEGPGSPRVGRRQAVEDAVDPAQLGVHLRMHDQLSRPLRLVHWQGLRTAWPSVRAPAPCRGRRWFPSGLAFTCARMPELNHDLHVQPSKSMTLLVHAIPHAVEMHSALPTLACTSKIAWLGKEALAGSACAHMGALHASTMCSTDKLLRR